MESRASPVSQIHSRVQMRVPILTYHSSDIRVNDYEGNDLVAFASDVQQIHSSGFRILPLSKVVDYWLNEPAMLESTPTIALTCDDGTDLDFHDLTHPSAGPQRSVLSILRDFRAAVDGDQPALCVTSFVI